MIRVVLVLLALLAGTSAAHAQAQKIVIDAGHGGNDPGGVGTGMQEKTIVLDVSRRFKALLEADTADTAGGGAWSAFMTRADDTFVSLAGRSAYSNSKDADRFMSIHSNAFGNTTANGTETFSLAETGNGAQLRNLVQQEMISAWKLTDRGAKTAGYAVLRDTAAPAILHELAFITNAGDAEKLASPEERQKAAEAHLRGLQRHYNLAPYIPNAGPGGQTGSIAGHVFDAAGPVVGATIALDGGESVTSGADGDFAFAAVAPGTHTLAVSAAAHAAKSVDVTVVAGAAAEAQIEIALDGDGGSGEMPDPDPGRTVTGGGCSTSSDVSWLALVGLAGLLARRRR